MEHELQAGKNLAWSTLSQIILRIFGLVFFVYISRRLLVGGMGQYNFVTSFVPMWFLLADFGVGALLLREWSKNQVQEDQVEKDFSIIFIVRFLCALVILVPFIIFNYYSNLAIFSALILSFISMFITIFAGLLDVYFQAKNLFKYITYRQIIEKSVTVFLGFVLLFFWPTLVSLFLAILAGQMISLVYYYFHLPFSVRWHFDTKRAIYLIRNGLPFLFIILFSTLYSRIDVVMLRFMDNFDSVGLYGIAYKFFDLAVIFPTVIFLPAVFPILSNLYSQLDKTKFEDFFYRCFRILFFFGVLSSLFFIIFAPFLVDIFFPNSFIPSVLALRILMIANAVVVVNVLFSNLLIVQGREKVGLKIVVICAIFNIVLNLFLIPKFSLYGAAWATVFAEIANLFLLQYYSIWKVRNKILFPMIVVVLINVLCLGTYKYFGILNNWFAGTSLLILDLFLFYFTKLFGWDDIKFFIRPFKIKFNNFFNLDSVI